MRSALLLLACLVAASSSHAQEEAARIIPFDGIEVFCHVLNYEKLAALGSWRELTQGPRESLLIVFGDSRKWHKAGIAKNELSQFLEAGGNLLVATDHEFAPPDLPFTITGKPALADIGPYAYRENARCPLLVGDAVLGGKHPIFGLLRQGIATNCPSRIKKKSAVGTAPANRGIIPLARYTKLSKEATPIDEAVEGRVAMAGSDKSAPPQGRVLAIAGHGLFMNGMMVQSDNDNFNFAINVVRWLREAPNLATRSKALFIVDGEVITNFDTKLAPPPPAPVPPVKAIDRLLRGLEKEGFFHRIVNRLIGENRDAFLSVLLAAVTFLLFLYGAKKLLEGRFQLETAVPRMVGALTSLVPPAPAAQQRLRMLFRQANLAIEGRLLARAWFHQEFGVAPEQWICNPPPALRVSGWSWNRWSLQRLADRVHSACAAEPAVMTRREFARLLRALPSLSAARRSGALALREAGKIVR